MDDKVIVTNRSALEAKYGKKVSKVDAAVKALVAADKKRGLTVRVVHIDDSAQMKKVKGKAVSSVKDRRGAKAAIDAVYESLAPDYMMILGASDVVPHQDLTNPVFDGKDDDDPVAWGDLPYACDVGYGKDPAKFVGPTRVVTRLPDLAGATDPAHLVALLKTAARAKPRPATEYLEYFGLSAEVWRLSSELTLDEITGNHDDLLLSPPKKPATVKGRLGARLHLINCHGGRSSPEFSGQRGTSYPLALDTRSTVGRIRPGTVAAVECCYGAELYDSVTLGIDVPICQSYLRQGCFGYLGSTTIAYGSEDDACAADLICRYFLLEILAGASVGRAALVARQRFVQNAAQMDPFDLKTLAQFCIYGDPSACPVREPAEPKKASKAEAEESARFRRRERRAKLATLGNFLKDTKPTASKRVKGGKPAGKAKAALSSIAAKVGLSGAGGFSTFKVVGATSKKSGKSADTPTRYHLRVGPTRGMPPKKGVVDLTAIIAKELNGRIIDYRVYYSR